jgi:elongation factor 1 alpha-like protein
MPWLNTPFDRMALLIPPLYPRAGLLGGSSNSTPKMSKLQVLAAARKKKAQEQQPSGTPEVDSPMTEAPPTINRDEPGSKSTETVATQTLRTFPLRKRKDSNSHEKPAKGPRADAQSETGSSLPSIDIEPPDQAEPSAFASTMFGSPAPPNPNGNLFTLPYTAITLATTTDPFAGPSPDDVVIAAQSKGSAPSGNATEQN